MEKKSMIALQESNLVIPQRLLKRGYSLKSFQETTIEQMLNSNSKKLFNAHEMGLGKTIQALVYANTLGLSRLLIVCSASARLNWARECDLWFNLAPRNQFAHAILSSKDFYEIKKRTLIDKTYHPSPIIVSYDLLLTNEALRHYLFNRTWDLVISDETHRVTVNSRGMEAQRTHMMMALWNHCERVLFLSGTPIRGKAADIYPTLSVIVNHLGRKVFTQEQIDYFKDFDSFANKFCYRYKSQFGTQYKGFRNSAELKAILQNKKGNFYFRELKRNVLPELPDKTYNPVELNLNPKNAIDDGILEYFLELFEKDPEEAAQKAKNSKSMSLVRRALGEAIANCSETYDFIEEILSNNEPVIIFAWHHVVIDVIAERLKAHKPLKFTGNTSPRDKQRIIDAFQNGQSDVFIGNIQAAGESINLTRASNCCFIEWIWDPGMMDQAIDRMHRIGQKDAVTAHFFITKNKFHSRMIGEVMRKQKNINKVI